jgi:hypothetical protein
LAKADSASIKIQCLSRGRAASVSSGAGDPLKGHLHGFRIDNLEKEAEQKAEERFGNLGGMLGGNQ